MFTVTRADLAVIPVVVERCAAGQLRDCYPAHTHDVEVRPTVSEPAVLTDLLEALVAGVLAADPHCRRVVFAAPAGAPDAVAAAESAGFRYIVDVDLRDAEVSLLVVEPDWARAVDMDLDRVPGS
jgi:hypothetical protein